jgi:hypothetical protein
VLSWSRATRDLLKSFGWGIGALHQLDAATMVPFPRRLPHSIFRFPDALVSPIGLTEARKSTGAERIDRAIAIALSLISARERTRRAEAVPGLHQGHPRVGALTAAAGAHARASPVRRHGRCAAPWPHRNGDRRSGLKTRRSAHNVKKIIQDSGCGTNAGH